MQRKITLPIGFGTVLKTLKEFTDKIYPCIENFKEISMNWLCENVILT
jgi:hypothetical protein